MRHWQNEAYPQIELRGQRLPAETIQESNNIIIEHYKEIAKAHKLT